MEQIHGSDANSGNKRAWCCFALQDFWPEAVKSSRVFALGEVWRRAVVTDLEEYANVSR
jgi:hypothetical protein